MAYKIQFPISYSQRTGKAPAGKSPKPKKAAVGSLPDDAN